MNKKIIKKLLLKYNLETSGNVFKDLINIEKLSKNLIDTNEIKMSFKEKLFLAYNKVVGFVKKETPDILLSMILSFILVYSYRAILQRQHRYIPIPRSEYNVLMDNLSRDQRLLFARNAYDIIRDIRVNIEHQTRILVKTAKNKTLLNKEFLEKIPPLLEHKKRLPVLINFYDKVIQSIQNKYHLDPKTIQNIIKMTIKY